MTYQKKNKSKPLDYVTPDDVGSNLATAAAVAIPIVNDDKLERLLHKKAVELQAAALIKRHTYNHRASGVTSTSEFPNREDQAIALIEVVYAEAIASDAVGTYMAVRAQNE